MEVVNNFFRTNRRHKIGLIILSGSLVFFSLWRLPYSPATWFDEGINIGIAKSLIQDGVYSLKIGPGQFVAERPFLITTNYPVLIPVAVSLKIFGISLTAARVPQVLFLWLFCLLAYLLVKKIYSPEAALLSLALIVTFSPFYGNGKAVLGEVPGLAYLLGGLLLLSGEFKTKKFFAAGLLFGLSAATKPFFLIVLPALLIGEIFNYAKTRALFWKRSFTLLAGLIIPLVLWLTTIISPFSLAEFGKTVGYYSNSYAGSNFLELVVLNARRFFTERTPIHFLLLLSVGLAGFVHAFKKNRFTEIEVILSTIIIITLAWYLKTPGWYRYFFPAHLLLLLFFPGALLAATLRRLAITVVVCLIIVQFGYLLTRRHDPLYNSDSAVRFSETVLSATSPTDTIFVINSPSAVFLLDGRPARQFLQINPKLFFGKNSLQDEQGSWYPYVVTSGVLENSSILHADEILAKQYSPVITVDKYLLYKKRTP